MIGSFGTAHLFTLLAAVSLGWKIVVATLVVRDLERRRVPVNKWLARLLVCAYAGSYRRALIRQTGRVTPLFYCLITSTALVLGSTVAAVIAHNL